MALGEKTTDLRRAVRCLGAECVDDYAPDCRSVFEVEVVRLYHQQPRPVVLLEGWEVACDWSCWFNEYGDPIWELARWDAAREGSAVTLHADDQEDLDDCDWWDGQQETVQLQTGCSRVDFAEDWQLFVDGEEIKTEEAERVAKGETPCL